MDSSGEDEHWYGQRDSWGWTSSPSQLRWNEVRCRRFYSFFFLMIRRPPSSPLFPYPTFFRSRLARGLRVEGLRPAEEIILIEIAADKIGVGDRWLGAAAAVARGPWVGAGAARADVEKRSEEHTSELQSPCNLVGRLLLEKEHIHAGSRRNPPSRRAPPRPVSGQGHARPTPSSPAVCGTRPPECPRTSSELVHLPPPLCSV